MSSAKLDALTPELFDIVLQDLGLDEIRNLRLVNKETCARATQERFLSFTARKRVEITPTGLDTFARMASQGCRLGRSVQHLTLVGVLYDLSILEGIVETGALSWLPTIGPGREASKQLSEEELVTARKYFDELLQRKEDFGEFHEAKKDLDLLSRAMRNISSEPHHKLDTLSLEVVVYDGGAIVEMSPKHKSPARYSKSHREQIFQIASENIRLVSLALREVESSVRHLEVFNGQTGPPCKLPYDVFDQIDWMEPKDSWPSFRALKALSLCVSQGDTQGYRLAGVNPAGVPGHVRLERHSGERASYTWSSSPSLLLSNACALSTSAALASIPRFLSSLFKSTSQVSEKSC